MLLMLFQSYPMFLKLSKCYQMLSKDMDVMNVKKHLGTFIIFDDDDVICIISLDADFQDE